MLADFVSKPKFLTDEECKEIVDYSDTLSFERGKWVNNSMIPEVNVVRKISLEANISKDDETLKGIIEKVTETVKATNENIFLFDIDYENELNEIKIVKLLGEEKAFISNHQKVQWVSQKDQRKIVANIMLNSRDDYEGGEWMLKDFTTPCPNLLERREVGRLNVFPAFRYVERTPVLSGKCYFLMLSYFGKQWK
jgi:hypothetical protein